MLGCITEVYVACVLVHFCVGVCGVKVCVHAVFLEEPALGDLAYADLLF